VAGTGKFQDIHQMTPNYLIPYRIRAQIIFRWELFKNDKTKAPTITVGAWNLLHT
jgi:hypothetical protein